MTAVRVPKRDTRFESRDAHEWKNRSMPGLVLTALATVLVLAMFVYGMYKWWTDDVSGTGVVMLLAGLTHALVGFLGPRLHATRQYLEVRRNGIHQKMLLGSASWSLSWAEISSIRLVFARTLLANGWFYEIETIHGQKKRIHPVQWQIVETDDPLYPRPRFNEWMSKPWMGKEYLQHSLLHASLGSPRSEDHTARSSQPTVEDFLRTSRGKLVVAIVAAGCLYAFLDWGQFSKYRFLHESFSTVLWSGVALFGAAGFLLTLGRNGTEKAIAVIFMLLPGFFVSAPLALRVNAATDRDGPAIRAYIATDGGFAAADGRGRYLDMSLHSRFREGVKPRKEQNLAIYRGVLGFEQLDLESIRWSE